MGVIHGVGILHVEVVAARGYGRDGDAPGEFVFLALARFAPPLFLRVEFLDADGFGFVVALHARRIGVFVIPDFLGRLVLGQEQKVSPVIDKALEILGEAERNALLLRYFNEKSHRETATALGVSEEAAKKRVSRALEKLRGYFASEGEKNWEVDFSQSEAGHNALFTDRSFTLDVSPDGTFMAYDVLPGSYSMYVNLRRSASGLSGTIGDLSEKIVIPEPSGVDRQTVDLGTLVLRKSKE